MEGCFSESETSDVQELFRDHIRHPLWVESLHSNCMFSQLSEPTSLVRYWELRIDWFVMVQETFSFQVLTDKSKRYLFHLVSIVEDFHELLTVKIFICVLVKSKKENWLKKFTNKTPENCWIPNIYIYIFIYFFSLLWCVGDSLKKKPETGGAVSVTMSTHNSSNTSGLYMQSIT